MSKQYDDFEVSKFFKDVFGDEKGKIVLAKIKEFCRGNTRQGIACVESANQTYYNLGAHSVYRYIQCRIDAELYKKQEDCVIEIETENQGD